MLQPQIEDYLKDHQSLFPILLVMDNPAPAGVPSYTRFSVMLKVLKYLGGRVDTLLLGGLVCLGFTILANSVERSAHASSTLLAKSVDLGRPGGFKAGIGTWFEMW